MSWPVPRPGLVVRYSYLWKDEADAGREDGSKDRPCAVVLAAEDAASRLRVIVLPVTHSPPRHLEDGIELPATTKARLGLDGERSWIILAEGSDFIWPGPDLRCAAGDGPNSAAYGYLPPRFFRAVRDRFVALARARRVRLTSRTE